MIPRPRYIINISIKISPIKTLITGMAPDENQLFESYKGYFVDHYKRTHHCNVDKNYMV